MPLGNCKIKNINFKVCSHLKIWIDSNSTVYEGLNFAKNRLRDLAIYPTVMERFWKNIEVGICQQWDTLGCVNPGICQQDAKRFKIFENRIQLYLKNIDVRQWIHAKSDSNPANDTSRELWPSRLGNWSRFSMALWIKLDSSWEKKMF